MGAAEVAAFLTYLATERGVAAATQNQAKSVLLFLYKEVLGISLPWLDEIVGAKNRDRLPVGLTSPEVRTLLHKLSGTSWLVAALLYGTGMRLLEGLRLRVKDVDFERRELVVRSGKGAKDRVTVLPENVVLPLKEQLTRAKVLHDRDLDAGFGAVWLPDALAVKYPNASRSWDWQWVFPGTARSVDPRQGRRAPASPARGLDPEGSCRRGAARADHQALFPPCVPALVRHAHAAGRL